MGHPSLVTICLWQLRFLIVEIEDVSAVDAFALHAWPLGP